MFTTEYDSDNKQFSLLITLQFKGKKQLRLWAEDLGKKNSKYVDRLITVDGSRSIYFSFPISPKQLRICVVNTEDVKDKDIQVTFLETKLRDYNIWIDKDTTDFLKLAMPFSQVCGFESATPNGRIYANENQKFQIKYMDVIRDVATGQIMKTPARIGHKSGRIEVAKVAFDKYTIPMRMAILLHEFSHVFKNPKTNLEISNEVGADINALYIYLGLGFSKIDAITVYANVFLKAQTKGNVERMRKIMDYINKFEQEDFAYKK